MNRSFVACVMSLAVLALPGFAQQPDFSKVEIKTTKLGDTVYMLEGYGGNIGLAAGEDDEIAKAGLTRDLDEKWGKGFLKPEQFVTFLAAGMRKAD